MTSSKTGLLLTILGVFVVVGLAGFGLRFLITKLVNTVQTTKARDEEEAQQQEANEPASSEAATTSSNEPPAEAQPAAAVAGTN